MDTPIPLIAVIFMGLAAVWFTRAVMQDEWVKNVAKGGWAPLVRHYPLTMLEVANVRLALCSSRAVLVWP
jgi:hypothetical protein